MAIYKTVKLTVVGLVLMVCFLINNTVESSAADRIEMAYIDPLSGTFGNAGDSSLKHYQYAASLINKAGGIGGKMVEIVPFDNKANPKDSLIQLQKAIDRGMRIIIQGLGSSVASALTGGIKKYNKRNPGKEVLFVNYAAVDPALTNKRCNFWHFRFDSHVDMKMAAITDWLKTQKDIKSVYILSQDYSFGKAVSAATVRMIKEKRPDIQIVGNEFHPIGKVKDFTPYVQKMMNAKADAIITGNWGSDMTLLIKAASQAGQKSPYLTLYGGGLGAPTAMGRSAVGLVKQVTEFHENLDASDEQKKKIDDFEKKYGTDYYWERIFTSMGMLSKAMEKAGTENIIGIAKALEGMEYETPYGKVYMRAEDHQLIQPQFISTYSDGVERDVENTGFGFKTDLRIPAEASALPTSCKMRRPS